MIVATHMSSEWFYKQPKQKWLRIDSIPFDIFWTVWDNYIEKHNTVHLHKTEPLFLIY